MQTEIMTVAGMTCGGCVSKVTNALKTIAGVADVNVSLSEGEVRVQFDESRTSPQQLRSAVEGAGYGMALAHGCHDQHGKGGCCG